MSVNFNKKSYPLGFSDLLPEGICGVTTDTYTPILKAKPFRITKLKKKKSHLQGIDPIRPIQLGLPIIMHTRSPVRLMKPLKKTKTVKPTPTLIAPTKKKKKPLFADSSISEMEINYNTIEMPDHLQDLATTNTVEVSETLLHKIARITEHRTKQLGQLLLASTAPSILAHAAAINYVSAVMQDSFDIEFEEDPSIGEAIRDITKIEVLEYFTQKLKVPKHRKEAIMTAFVDKMTTHTVNRMEVLMKQGHTENKVKALEAVLATRSKGSESVVVRGKTKQDQNSGQQERVLQRPMLTVPPRKSSRI